MRSCPSGDGAALVYVSGAGMPGAIYVYSSLLTSYSSLLTSGKRRGAWRHVRILEVFKPPGGGERSKYGRSKNGDHPGKRRGCG